MNIDRNKAHPLPCGLTCTTGARCHLLYNFELGGDLAGKVEEWKKITEKKELMGEWDFALY
jgi:hypothetical protein